MSERGIGAPVALYACTTYDEKCRRPAYASGTIFSR